VIPLTTTEGRLVDVRKAEIEEVLPLGDGAVVYLTGSAPIRVMQSAHWIIGLLDREGHASNRGDRL